MHAKELPDTQEHYRHNNMIKWHIIFIHQAFNRLHMLVIIGKRADDMNKIIAWQYGGFLYFRV